MTARPIANPQPAPARVAAVEVDHVCFTYPGAASSALSDISLRVEPGERLGILGPNGGGKSTLLKLILGLLRPSSGTIRVGGLSPEAARKRGVIGYVPQRSGVELALPISAREVVQLAASWRANPFRTIPRALAERAERMIELTGVSAFASRPAGKLSGGQLQRVLIARALAADARILALDEPMVGIDAAGQEQFAALLDRLHRELGDPETGHPLTILIISHDIRAVAAGSDRVACLSRRLHSHTSPQGLTPQVLAELFAHDIAGLPGALHGMHIHAHGTNEPCTDPAHAHGTTGPDSRPVSLNVSASGRSIGGVAKDSGGGGGARVGKGGGA